MSNVLLTAAQDTEQPVGSQQVQLDVLEQTAKYYLRELHSSEVLDKGILFIPRAIKYIYKEIGVTITEFAVLEYLLIQWYQQKKLPEVSLSTLAQELGKSKIQVWRHLKKLQEKGFLLIIHIFGEDGGQHQNRYDLYPFIIKLEAYMRQQGSSIEDQQEHASSAVYQAAQAVLYQEGELTAGPTTALPPLYEQGYTAQPIELTAATFAAEEHNDSPYPATAFTTAATPPIYDDQPAFEPSVYSNQSALEPSAYDNQPIIEPQAYNDQPALKPQAYNEQPAIEPAQAENMPRSARYEANTYERSEPTPIRKKPSFELPPPALGPKTPGRHQVEDGYDIASPLPDTPREASTQASTHSSPDQREPTQEQPTREQKAAEGNTKNKKTKSSHTAKSNKKQETQNTPTNHVQDSREAARKLVEIYTHVDVSPRSPQVPQTPGIAGPESDTGPASLNATGVTNAGTQQEPPASPSEKKPFALSPQVVEYMRSCVEAFMGSALDVTSAYKVLTRIYKKIAEVQQVIECSEEDVEADFMTMLEEIYDYTQAEIHNNPDNPPDALLFFLDALDDSVDALRISASDEWFMALLEEHEQQFQRQPWGIPEVKPFAMQPKAALKKPMSLFTLQQSSFSPPRGGQLLARLRHYGIKLERKQESNLLGSYPDIQLLNEIQGVIRMEQFRDEQNQIKKINVWRINGNTLDAFWKEHRLPPVERTRNKHRSF